ncbi:Type IV secretory pathway, VirB4 component [Geosporobacter subterraneus DSM 17957]|uniref:Type IV secretory pathway, VirB4 component n=2 Tax=Geosporobacter TaxID=390805 RepID=A0A1M6HF78_9FIRM|nr:Type IV secretory pathway, VirB4 component [Geosporobacter subterraneus DSM 17957]
MPTKKKQPTRQKKRLPGNVRQTKNRKALQGKKTAPKPSGNTGGFAASVRMKLFGRADAPQTAQQSIPYREMYRDGVCRVTDRLYTKTIVFQDITYQLAQNEDKTQIFENYCNFLSYFDSSVSVQLSFINQYGNLKEFQQSIDIPEQEDEYNSIRREYADMLKNQLAKGNNGLVKTKFITFGIEADSLKAAKPRMERVEADILANFKTMGVKARTLSGLERLEVLHGQFHPDGQEKLRFSWEDIPKTGLSTRDYIAPTSFDFRDGKTFRMGEHYGAVSFLSILAPELTDRMLVDFLDLDTAVTVNLHIRSIDQAEAIKTVKRKLSDLDKMKIEEQKKAVRSGYDMDIIPTDLATYGNEAKTLLEDLQNRNERMFLVTVLVLNTAKKRQQLENDIFQAAGVAQKYNCALKRLDYQQEQGLMSSLPVGLNQIEIKRGLTTSSVAIFVPFTTQELFQQGEALYYGLNALSNNLIMASRKRLKNPNGLFLGTPGSGKSFAAKREIVNVFLLTNDDIIISDPEAEYFPLVNRLGGQVVKLSPVSAQYINPMDINPDYSDDEDPLTLKSDFILSLCELIVGGKEGLQPVEKTIIDRCVRLVYREYLAAPSPEKMPILQDLYNLLRKQTEPEAQHIATALEIYVTGSLNVFNHRTNVDITNRLVCYDIKELGKQLKKLGMLILQDQVWGRVTANRATHRTTWFYQDEFHLLLKEEQTAAYSLEIWKRFRKWGGIPSALTQNVKDLLASREIENILENSDFIYMLNQAGGDRQILAKQLGISNHQLSYVTHSGAGEGLLFYGNTIIPFIDRFPKDTELYRIMTTKPDEVKGA